MTTTSKTTCDVCGVGKVRTDNPGVRWGVVREMPAMLPLEGSVLCNNPPPPTRFDLCPIHTREAIVWVLQAKARQVQPGGDHADKA